MSKQVLCAGGCLSVLLVATVLARAAEQADQRVPPRTSPFADAPSAAATWRNPYGGQLAAIRAGEKLYQRHCAHCHGTDGRGGVDAPGLRSTAIRNAPAGILYWFITDGQLVKGMPSWDRLPDERRWQIVTYIEALQARQADPPDGR